MHTPSIFPLSISCIHFYECIYFAKQKLKAGSIPALKLTEKFLILSSRYRSVITPIYFELQIQNMKLFDKVIFQVQFCSQCYWPLAENFGSKIICITTYSIYFLLLQCNQFYNEFFKRVSILNIASKYNCKKFCFIPIIILAQTLYLQKCLIPPSFLDVQRILWVNHISRTTFDVKTKQQSQIIQKKSMKIMVVNSKMKEKSKTMQEMIRDLVFNFVLYFVTLSLRIYIPLT